MMMPAKMTKLSIVGGKKKLAEFVDAAFSLRALHIVDFEEGAKAFSRGSPLPEGVAASRTLMEVRKVKGILGIDAQTTAGAVPAGKVADFSLTAFPRLLGEVDSLGEKLAKATNEKARLEERLATLAPLETLPKNVHLNYRVGQVAAGRSPAKTRDRLRGLIPSALCVGSDDVQFILVPSKDAARLREALALVPWEPIEVPETDMPIGALFAKMRGELEKAEAEISSAETRKAELSKTFSASVLALEEKLEVDVEKAETPVHFGFSEHFFICDAWVPASRAGEVKTKLEAVESIQVTVEKGKEDEAPVTLDNVRPVRSYQILVAAFERPKSAEIDPTIFVAITFPIFFGFMLGDIGYAVVMVVLLLAGVYDWLLEFLGMGGSKVALRTILYFSAAWSFIFGVIFGEFFGAELFGPGHLIDWIEYGQYHIAGLPYNSYPGLAFPIDRMHETGTMITLCLLAGVAHLYLAWMLGLINSWRLHGFKHALLSKGSWLLIITGTFMWVYRLIGVLMLGYEFELSAWEIVGSFALATGAAIAVVGEGPTSLIEIPMNTLSNSLSYTRLFAVGLSSVGIALAVNEYIAGPFLDMGGVWVVVGIALLVGGHTVNFGLGMIAPSLHSLRLHYVEFFTKFFEGGGEKYTPLGRAPRYVSEGRK